MQTPTLESAEAAPGAIIPANAPGRDAVAAAEDDANIDVEALDGVSVPNTGPETLQAAPQQTTVLSPLARARFCIGAP